MFVLGQICPVINMLIELAQLSMHWGFSSNQPWFPLMWMWYFYLIICYSNMLFLLVH